MKRLIGPVAATAILALPAGGTVAQQPSPAHHRYLFQAVFTADGIKNLQKQTASGFRSGVAKAVEAAGGRLESWYYDYADNTAYGFVDYPDEIAAATTQATVNAAGLAHVVYRPVLMAEDADKAFLKSIAARLPQQQ